jgi:hypothetical protein
VLIDHLPTSSATARSVAGHPWTTEHMLLTRIEYGIRVLSWQWSMKGKKPEPIKLPGIDVGEDEGHWGGKGIPIEEMRERLGWD